MKRNTSGRLDIVQDALIYLAANTRYDIAYGILSLTQHNVNKGTQQELKAAKCILRYSKEDRHFG